MTLTMPKKGQDYFQALWLILDKDDKGSIQRSDLSHIVELVRLKTTNLSDRSTLAEKWMPSVYNSAPSKFVISCVKHVIFRYLFDFIILVNAVCIAFDVDAKWLNIFLLLFSVEIVLKLYSFGTRAFFQKLWNIFDVVVVGSALAVSVYQAIRPDQLDPDSLDLLLVMRVIRIFKIFHSIPRFRIVIDTILHILPSMGIYGAILLLFYYSFAIVGMEVFGGRFKYTGYGDKVPLGERYCDNPQLKDSSFFRAHYCSNNFNNIFSSFVTLFDLMVVNQWHVIAEGHVFVTSRAARFFFFLFHFICVIVILNIFSAFVIEAFILEYSARATLRPISPLMARINEMGLGYGTKPVQASSKQGRGPGSEQLLEDDQDSTFLDADHGSLQIAAGDTLKAEEGEFRLASSKTTLRFHLRKRSRTVQGLLERMFEDELGENHYQMY